MFDKLKDEQIIYNLSCISDEDRKVIQKKVIDNLALDILPIIIFENLGENEEIIFRKLNATCAIITVLICAGKIILVERDSTDESPTSDTRKGR